MGTAVNARGPGCLGFLAWKHCSLLASAEREICCVVSMVFSLWSGFHLWNSLLSQVTGSVSASPPVKPRSSFEKTEDPVLSVRLVFHGHVVASVAAPLKKKKETKTLHTRLENSLIQILWITFSPPVQHLLPYVFFYVTTILQYFFPALL